MLRYKIRLENSLQIYYKNAVFSWKKDAFILYNTCMCASSVYASNIKHMYVHVCNSFNNRMSAYFVARATCMHVPARVLRKCGGLNGIPCITLYMGNDP